MDLPNWFSVACPSVAFVAFPIEKETQRNGVNAPNGTERNAKSNAKSNGENDETTSS